MIFVVYHEQEALDRCDAPNAVKYLYDNLTLPRWYHRDDLGDARFFLYLWYNRISFGDYQNIGIFSATFDKKFARLGPLRTLESRYYSDNPTDVIAPNVCRDYLTQADLVHPGMAMALKEVLNDAKIPIRTDRPGVMCNNFIASGSVWNDFIPAYFRMFRSAERLGYFEPGQPWDIATDFTQHRRNQGPAYLCERFTCAWFSSREDLTVSLMRTETGGAYACYDREPGVTAYYPAYSTIDTNVHLFPT